MDSLLTLICSQGGHLDLREFHTAFFILSANCCAVLKMGRQRNVCLCVNVSMRFFLGYPPPPPDPSPFWGASIGYFERILGCPSYEPIWAGQRLRLPRDQPTIQAGLESWYWARFSPQKKPTSFVPPGKSRSSNNSCEQLSSIGPN